MSALLDSFLQRLQARESTDDVRNPYSVTGVIENLRYYLLEMLESADPILIVGEAPGHRGCGITGIPFTSGDIIMNSRYDLWCRLRNKITLPELSGENSASVVWQAIDNYNFMPIMWNAFPFHPHKNGNMKSNRTPKAKEIQEGLAYLRDLAKLFRPQFYAGIGRKGQQALKNITNPVHYVRHPSYGGKPDFEKGMQELAGMLKDL